MESEAPVEKVCVCEDCKNPMTTAESNGAKNTGRLYWRCPCMGTDKCFKGWVDEPYPRQRSVKRKLDFSTPTHDARQVLTATVTTTPDQRLEAAKKAIRDALEAYDALVRALLQEKERSVENN